LLVNAARCTVLLVDDDAAILRVAQHILAADYDILTASSTEAAVRILSVQKIDLLLVDQRMPGMTGVQLLEWAYIHIPYTVRILMSGAVQVEDTIEAINVAHVSRFLLKPWRPEMLQQTLRSATRERMLEISHQQLLEELRRVNLELESRVHQRTLELELANRQLQQRNTLLQKMALTDTLTNLPNRRGSDRLARTELLRRTRTRTPLMMGLIDVDHFKRINSRYLHSGGDHVLIWLTQLLSAGIRPIDTLGRVGGEEFLLILPEVNSETGPIHADRLRRKVESSSTIFNQEEIRVTVSMGLILIDGDSFVGYDDVRHQAAIALREAKETGRNRCVIRRFGEISERQRTPLPPSTV